MARISISGFLTALAMAAVALQVAKAEDTVGDTTGWTMPPSTNFYSNWASRKTFEVGDKLVFRFTTGQHDVTVVNKQAYDGCSTANAMQRLPNGPVTYTLNSTGMHYFICGFPGHCSAGQKLAVNVAADDDSAPKGSPSTPSGGSGTPSTPSGARTPPSTNSPAGSSAAARGVAFGFVLVSIAVAMFC